MSIPSPSLKVSSSSSSSSSPSSSSSSVSLLTTGAHPLQVAAEEGAGILIRVDRLNEDDPTAPLGEDVVVNLNSDSDDSADERERERERDARAPGLLGSVRF